MQFLLDNISASMVYASIALVVISTQINTQRTTIQQSLLYQSTTQTLQFADTIEREFKLIGAGMTNRSQMLAGLETDANGNAESFSFRYVDMDKKEHLIEYRLVESGVAEVNGVEIQLYSVNRFDNGQRLGGGPSTLRRFQVQYITGGGTTTNDPVMAEMVRVTMNNMLADGDLDDYFLPETTWAVTLRPLNLAI